MDDALDMHYRLLQEEDAVQRCRDALAYLAEAGIDHFVEGGWSVAAHGSPVESVDLDIIIAFDELERFKQEMLDRHDMQLDATGTSILGIDTRDLHAHNALLDRPELGYVPADLLAGRSSRRPLRLIPDVEARVPDLDALALMKAKAWHNRRLAWEAGRDPVRLARLEYTTQKWIRTMGPLHWTRKAGKDLFDLAFLESQGADNDYEALVDEATATAIKRSLTDIPLPLRRFAEQMAKRHDVDLALP